MAQQQTDNLNDVNSSEEHSKNSSAGSGNNSKNLQNGTDGSNNSRTHNTKSPAMNEKIKSPSGPGVVPTLPGGPQTPNNGNNESNQGPPSSHPYDNSMGHYQHPPGGPHPGSPHPSHHHPNDKDDMNNMYGHHPHHPPPPHHPAYGRYHHGDPNMDPYRYGPPPPQQTGGKPGGPPGSQSPAGAIRPPPQQRYIPGQSPQGPTPTLNSLLQSHPPPPQHRYSNSYDPQQQQPGGPPGQQQSLPPTSQPQQQPAYGPQQGGWAPPPRPYSPQMGPSQQYRTPPPANTSRGQSPYPPTPPSHGQNSGSYPSSPQQQQQQQPGGPPPPPTTANQGSATTPQYAPYPQRYPTPPGGPNPGGPNHRTPYSTHQYPEPNRPWPGSPSPAASPGPGGHPHPPASPHQHGGSGPPPPNSPGGGHAPSPSPQPSQASPSPHQELIGQNSNDSSSGGGVSGTPGTPNSQQQVMRPTPSPTGSAGSRSMSPAIGQRPSSNQSQSSSSQQMPPTTSVLMPHINSASNVSQQPPQNPSNNNSQQSSSSQHPPPPQQQPPPGSGINNMSTNQGNYPPRPQYPPGNYGPAPPATSGGPLPPATGSNHPPGSPHPPPNQYQGRQMPNHGGSGHPQFPPGGGYQQNWVPPSPGSIAGMGNHIQGKGTPPPQSPGSVGSPRPVNYLKHHLQHKGGSGGGGYMGGSPSPTPPQNYHGNGPGMHHMPSGPMGPPPHHMGPPPHGPTSMGPPSAAPPPSDNLTPSDQQSVISQDNGVSTSGPSSAPPPTGPPHHPVTSIVTTGPPDGAGLDEASQQSTLSNASAASGEDPQCTTPKSRKNDPYNQSHLSAPITSPGNAAGSGHPPPPHSGSGIGTGSTGSGNDDFEMRSPPPSWPTTPASPGFNSHVPQETFRPSATKKSDSLCKLYEMDDSIERRPWLDKLLFFMDERKTPITACPTISKTPLDLYRLYTYVKERGGFVEVCKVTKSKTWKDIAGLLGIGASSSAAYTLRKHYTKNLLAYECHFDRGGIDPIPIIQQIEAGSKKKSAKPVSVPSPAGSSNSQDSFPPPPGGNTSIDGYPGYPGPVGYPPGPGGQPDYSAVPQRPPSQSNAQNAHPGSPYPGQPGYNQYGAADQYNSSGPPGQYPQNQGQFPPPNRTMYPPYGPEGDNQPPGPNAYGPYGNRPYSQPPGAPGAQPPSQANSGTPTPPGGPPTGPPGQGPYPPPPTDYNYRPPEANQPRRHPDFVKDSQPYPGYNQRPQMYGGWQGATNQYRGPPYSSGPPPPSQPWSQTGPRTTAPPGGAPNQPPVAGQWDQHRYPQPSPYQQQSNQPGGPPPPQWANMQSPQQQQQPPQQQMQSGPPGSPLRPPQQQQRMPPSSGPQPVPSGKTFNMPPPQMSNAPGGMPPNKMVPHQQPGPCGTVPTSTAGPVKKEIVFPSDSIEATTPILYRRKKYTRADVCPVDPWRIFMSLRSGLLAESTWALDLLNILLFDDTAVQYFGLSNLPGLLNLLLEHFQKNLSEMFDVHEETYSKSRQNRKKQRQIKAEIDDESEDYIDLGQIKTLPNPEERVILMTTTTNYTMVSRKGIPVRIQNSEDDIFIGEHIKAWDYDSNSNYQLSTAIGSDPWTYDQFEPHTHDSIIDVFKSEFVHIPFAPVYGGGEVIVGSRKRRKSDVMIVKEEKEEDDNISEDSSKFNPINTVRDPATILKRRRMSDYEDECYSRDEASIYLVSECHDTLARRCICISNIFRNLTFVPGNEIILAKSSKFLAILGKLLLLNHEHLIRTPKTRNYDREEDMDFTDSCSSLQGEKEWWWEYLIQIRENMLVAIANLAGHLELSHYEEIITRPVLDGLLHWAICPSAHGQDPFPSCGPHSSLSPQRLALEALCKLCVTDANVDLVIATPPFSRLEKLCAVLTRHLCKNEDQVLREFSVNLLHYLAAADSAMARTVALQSPCISYLVTFIEQAEQTALGVANQHGINYLRENPDSMGTSLDMLRRAAGTLLHLSKHPDNKSLFMQQEQRLLGLVMSHILDQQVALIISRVLFQVSRAPGVTAAGSIPAKIQIKTSANTSVTSSSSLLVAEGENSNDETIKATSVCLQTPSANMNDVSNSSSNCSNSSSASSCSSTSGIVSSNSTTTTSLDVPGADKMSVAATNKNSSTMSSTITGNNNSSSNNNNSSSSSSNITTQKTTTQAAVA